jgi:sugar phosphate isomerase/epimerase
MQLSLAHLTLLDVPAAELIGHARDQGCRHVCFFVKVPLPLGRKLPVVESVAEAEELRRRMDDAGLTPGSLEAYVARPGVAAHAYRETLEIGAALGARRITGLNFEPDPAAAVDSLADFCALASDYGMRVGLEWYRFSCTRNLGEALELVRRVAQPNLTLTVDSLHMMRNGNAPADFARVDPRLLDFAQISDGPLEVDEAQHKLEGADDRAIPGEGAFPLVDFVRHMPPDAVLCVEVPMRRHLALPPAERARMAVDGVRRILAAAGR